MPPLLLLVFLCGGATACDEPSGPRTAETTAQPGVAGSGGTGASAGVAARGGASGEPATPAVAGRGGGPVVDSHGCTEASRLVHLVTNKNELFRFDPPTGTLAKVTQLACPSSSGTYSMAIARNGTGYLVLRNGTLQRFDITTGSCEETPYVSGQLGFKTFGMGFVSSDAEQETLFVTHSSGTRLGKIDLTTYTLSEVGSLDALQGVASEIAGTDAGELFGVFQRSPSAIAQIDPQSAKVVAVFDDLEMPFPTKSHFAFAAYGGKLWTFVGPGGFTDVFAFDPATKSSVKTATIPVEVIGASASTCGPGSEP